MNGMDGFELQQILLKKGFSLPIIFITGHGDVPMCVNAMKNGAFNFLLKPFSKSALLDIINDAKLFNLRHL